MKELFLLPLLISTFVHFHDVRVLSASEVKDFSTLSKDRYNQLSPFIKWAIWKSRLSTVENLCAVNSEQKYFSDSLANALPIEMFDTMSREADITVRKVSSRAIELFGKHKASFIFTSLSATVTEYDSIPSPNQPKTSDCNCSKESDWCSGRSSCKEKVCNKTKGCGTFFLYPCDGLCSY